MQIAFQETELRERAKHLGAMWRPAQKVVRDLTWETQSAWELQIVQCRPDFSGYPPLDICRHIGPSTYRCLHPRIEGSSIAAMQFND